MFQETYRRMNDPIVPSPELKARSARPPCKRGAFRRPLTAAAAAVLCLSLAVPAAARTGPGYDALYAVSPSVAQFFQPVQKSDTDNGVRMEVVSVSVEGDTAQAYVTLTDLEGERVDGTTDLYDSYALRVPFDSVSHCERVGYDADSHTAAFLITQQTMNGREIPGGKLTFSVGCFLSGKEAAEDLAVSLPLQDYAGEAATTDRLSGSGGGGESYAVCEDAPMLAPQGILAEPAVGLPVTAAGYAGGLLHIQVELKDQLRTDNHCWLYLKNSGGQTLEPMASVYFTNGSTGEDRETYVDFLFDIAPETLNAWSLYGDFYTAAQYTEGSWRVTFPLRDTP